MLLLYGITGFTGRLVASEFIWQNIPFIAAGRNEHAIRNALLASKASAHTEVRVFGLDHHAPIVEHLKGITVVLNCAGPFSRTAAALAKAAIAAGCHYLDLAGEIEEHEAVRALSASAIGSGSMLMPGVGFGCVPTDVAAVEASRRLNEPVAELLIAYETNGGASRGTLESVLRGIHKKGLQRRSNKLVAVSPGAERQKIDLGGGEVLLVTNPWRADQVTAFFSTRAREITTLANFPLPARLLMSYPGFAESKAGKWLVEKIISATKQGPSEAEMASGSTRILAIATSASGKSREARIAGPDAYLYTARTAALVAKKVLAGAIAPGFAAPSSIVSFNDLLGVEGVSTTTFHSH